MYADTEWITIHYLPQKKATQKASGALGLSPLVKFSRQIMKNLIMLRLYYLFYPIKYIHH